MTTGCTVDPGKNHQGEALNDLLRSTGLCIVNWTKGKDAFTCVSSIGSSVVGYFIVPCGNLSMIEEFRIITMAKSIDEMKLRGEPLRVPDHSLLLWEVVMKDARVWEEVESEQSKEPESKVRYKF